jgi:hypothetical protein
MRDYRKNKRLQNARPQGMPSFTDADAKALEKEQAYIES